MKKDIEELIENIHKAISEFEQRTGIDIEEIRQNHYISGGVSIVTSRNIKFNYKERVK
jgi:phenylpyruvate tautomerase PptA (4-oxalocrotonate tautomerase family)